MYLHAEYDYSEVETIRFNEAYAWDDHQLKPFFYSWIIYYYRFLRTFFISGQEPDTDPISDSHASPSLSHIAEYLGTLEIKPTTKNLADTVSLHLWVLCARLA